MDELLVSAAAESDYTELLQWYAARSMRAAEGLEAEFVAALSSIAEHPERYPFCNENHRYYLLKRYLVQVIYRPTVDSQWLIVAVAHTSREPNYWIDRG